MLGSTEQSSDLQATVSGLRRHARALLREVRQRAWEMDHELDTEQLRTNVDKTKKEIEQLQQQIQQACPSQAERRPFKRLEHKWARLLPSLRSKLEAKAKSESEAMRLKQLRTLRTDVQDLRSTIGRVRTGKTSWNTCSRFITSCVQHVNELFQGIERDFPDMQSDDEFRHLRDLWQQVEALVNEGPPDEKLDDKLARLEVIEALCHEIVSTIGWRTIPDRLNAWLDNALPGTPISFHKVFDDELPEIADRQRLLGFLSFAPKKLKNALVDAESGFVYKYHRQRWIRWTMFSVLVLVSILATAGVLATGAMLIYDRVPDLKHGENPLGQLFTLFTWWVAVVAGVAFHTAADSIKRARTLGTSSASGLTVGHITQWVDARINALLLRLAMMAIGAIGAFAMLKDQLVASGSSPIFTMFLVGYGLDSFVGMFFDTVGDRAAAQTALLKKQMSAAEHTT